MPSRKPCLSTRSRRHRAVIFALPGVMSPSRLPSGAMFYSVPPHTPHNDAQDDLIEMMSEIFAERLVAASDPDEHDPALIIAFLMANETLVSAVRHAWPILDSADIVADLWSVPAYLRLCGYQRSRTTTSSPSNGKIHVRGHVRICQSLTPRDSVRVTRGPRGNGRRTRKAPPRYQGTIWIG